MFPNAAIRPAALGNFWFPPVSGPSARRPQKKRRHGHRAHVDRPVEADMGINSPSLYAAFGGHESLFRESVERYR